MKAAARLLVVLAAVWGGSLLIQSPVAAEYYSGAAARAFLKAQEAKRRDEARTAVVYGPVRQSRYVPHRGGEGYRSTPWAPAQGGRGRGAVSRPRPGGRRFYRRALAAPQARSVAISGGSSFGRGVGWAGSWGVARAYRRGLTTRWAYGPRVPSHFYFSNRGLLGWGTGRFAIRIGW